MGGTDAGRPCTRHAVMEAESCLPAVMEATPRLVCVCVGGCVCVCVGGD
jgi:hypothetical protein